MLYLNAKLLRIVILIIPIIFFSNHAYSLKLSLKGVTDAIDKVAEGIDERLTTNEKKEAKSVTSEESNEEEQNEVVDNKSKDTISELVLVEIDENISEVKTKDLKKLKTIDMERLLFGTASLGFYENGDIFEDIHSPNSSDQKGEYKSILNESQDFKGVYKIAQSKICYLIDGTDDWQCAILYKHKKLDGIYYWAQKGKIFAKIVKVMDIPAYEKMKFDHSEAEKVRREEEKRLAEEKRIADEKAAEEKRVAEEKRIAEEERIAEELMQKKLSLILSETDLEKAQFYLQMVQDFSKQNPDEFDFVELMGLFSISKPVLDGIFDEEQKNNIKNLRNLTDSSANFVEYENSQLQIKTNKSLSDIDVATDLLSLNINNLKTYMQENMTSNFISKILEEIKVSEMTLNDPNSLFEINDANTRITNLQKDIKKIEEKIVLAESYIKKLKDYLQENMTSDLLPEILNIIKSLEKNIEVGILNDLTKVNEDANNFILSKIEVAQVTTSSENNDANLTISNSIPDDQQQFVLVVENAKTKKTENDFQIGQVLTSRNADLKKIFTGNGIIKDWIGIVKDLDSNSDGKGILSILINANVNGKEKKSFHVETWNNALSDWLANTLIEPNTNMYQKMGYLSEGDKVKFSGSFFIDDDGMIETQNLSKKGKINKPGFTFKFSDISKL